MHNENNKLVEEVQLLNEIIELKGEKAIGVLLERKQKLESKLVDSQLEINKIQEQFDRKIVEYEKRLKDYEGISKRGGHGRSKSCSVEEVLSISKLSGKSGPGQKELSGFHSPIQSLELFR